MKNKTIIVVLASLLIFSFANSSHAITITGSDTITKNSSSQYTAFGCSGTVSWSVTGTGASISSNGVLTTGSVSCGGITVTARCSDGSITTKTARVTNAGQWVAYPYVAIMPGCTGTAGTDYHDPEGDELRGYAYFGRQCGIAGSNPITGCYDPWPGTPDFSCIGAPLSHGCDIPGAWVCFYHIGYTPYKWQCPSCTNGQTISCYTGPAETLNVGSECKAGTQTCSNGQWGACVGEVLPSAEICDGLDNDCNGIVDDIPSICYTGPIGTQGVGICKTGTHVCENGTYSACIGEVTPQEDICDGLDNNCDGTIDEGCGQCSVPPLTPLTDPLAIRMENGETVIYDGLTTAMQQSVDCFSDEVFNAGGTLNITSAYRPRQYQQHLREVWDKYDLLENTSDPACDELKSEIREEFQRHRLRYRPARTSRHTAGTAIDASWNLPTGQSIDALANRCVLSRPVPNDPIHFELRR